MPVGKFCDALKSYRGTVVYMFSPSKETVFRFKNFTQKLLRDESLHGYGNSKTLTRI